MVSARVIVLSVNPHYGDGPYNVLSHVILQAVNLYYDVSLYYGVSLSYGVCC